MKINKGKFIEIIIWINLLILSIGTLLETFN